MRAGGQELVGRCSSVVERCFRKAKTWVRFPPSAHMNKEEIQKKIEEIEAEMASPDFWVNKERAQRLIKEVQLLKSDLSGVGKYDKGDAILTIFSGAGGVDAEDFAKMLLDMYLRFFEIKNFSYHELEKSENDFGGIRSITLEVSGSSNGLGAYGILKNESGVHRLVRMSPFNSKGLRHTSFAMVEFVPKLPKQSEIEIKDEDLKIEFSRSSGPGGQNVNKRETAVRIVHIPTNLSASVDGERTQLANKEKALQILAGKLYYKETEDRKMKEKGLQIRENTEPEWGSQIRSYVLHPYKLVKDHRTGIETSNAEAVLDGKIDEFIEAEHSL